MPEGVAIVDVAWTPDGRGVWLATNRSAIEDAGGADGRVARWRPGSGLVTLVTTGKAPVSSPFGGRIQGLAPDDSRLVVVHETADGRSQSVVVGEEGDQFEVEGSFARWLEVEW